MRVYSILSYIDILEEAGLLVKSYVIDKKTAIEHITYNSKNVKQDTLFACKGASFKLEFLHEAIKNGCVCYVSEVIYESEKETSYIIVNDIRKAMAVIADAFYGSAYNKLNLVGITGTKGKTTTAYYIKYILDEFLQATSHKPSGIISSIDVFDGKDTKESTLTTPEAFELHQHFDNAVQNGLEYFEMEVSSQALKYDRVAGVSFDIGVFLNISNDHISPTEHTDFDDYLNSKLKIFSQTKLALICSDTQNFDEVVASAKESCEVVLFGMAENADYCGYNVKKDGNDTVFSCKSKNFDTEFALSMPGLFNVENALASIAICDRLDIPVKYIKAGLYKARSSGRMEVFKSHDMKRLVIVDYAHNMLSFEKLYQSTLEEFSGRKIITVFGCPGGKAYNRRKELGKVAGEYSSRIYLTADDSGIEEIAGINSQIRNNIKGSCECFEIEDRATAIKQALEESEENSIILVLGKGNDTTQKVGKTSVPYETDSVLVKQYLNDMAKSELAEQIEQVTV